MGHEPGVFRRPRWPCCHCGCGCGQPRSPGESLPGLRPGLMSSKKLTSCLQFFVLRVSLDDLRGKVSAKKPRRKWHLFLQLWHLGLEGSLLATMDIYWTRPVCQATKAPPSGNLVSRRMMLAPKSLMEGPKHLPVDSRVGHTL